MLGFIGAGTIATVLAGSLRAEGYTVTAVASRSFSSAQKLAALVSGCVPLEDMQHVVNSSDILFITTPDDVISEVAGQIEWQTGKSVVHCSGADSSEILHQAKLEGARTGVFHPLQTFAGAAQTVKSLKDITFSLEAEEPLLTHLKEMADALGGHWIVLKSEDRVLYHASAVMVSNYLVTLLKLATDLWAGFGVTREEAVKALLPLIEGTVSNIDTLGLPGCLTGPISRGDSGTVKKHLRDLANHHHDILGTYRELGLKTIPIALEKGRIDTCKAREIEAVLTTRNGEGKGL
jgi:predicted short-subunit dehydrogenase-like oxidoreductase (DUF2520 family)